MTSSQVGQRSRVPSKIVDSKHTRVVTILQTEASETPNMSPIGCRFTLEHPDAVCKAVLRDTLLSKRNIFLPSCF